MVGPEATRLFTDGSEFHWAKQDKLNRIVKRVVTNDFIGIDLMCEMLIIV